MRRSSTPPIVVSMSELSSFEDRSDKRPPTIALPPATATGHGYGMGRVCLCEEPKAAPGGRTPAGINWSGGAS